MQISTGWRRYLEWDDEVPTMVPPLGPQRPNEGTFVGTSTSKRWDLKVRIRTLLFECQRELAAQTCRRYPTVSSRHTETAGFALRAALWPSIINSRRVQEVFARVGSAPSVGERAARPVPTWGASGRSYSSARADCSPGHVRWRPPGSPPLVG